MARGACAPNQAIGQQYGLHLSDDAFELGLTLLLRGLRGELSGA
jgi:hypothetical protein